MKIGMLVLFINMFRYIVYIYFYYLGCFLVLWPNVIFRKYLTIFTEYTYLPIFISIKHKIRVLAFRALLSAHPILTKKKKFGCINKMYQPTNVCQSYIKCGN